MSSGSGARLAERLWYGNSSLALLLAPFSWLYRLVVSLRRRLYLGGWLRSHRVAAPVIVVGNITVGGTGKTPVVEWLVTRLRAEGFRPGVVSRGYGGTRQHAPVRVTSGSSVDQVGDEPLLLWRRTGAPISVCVDRVAAAESLVADGADVIVADDGLQHYALARDLELIVVDGARRLGNARMLPAGPLREPVARMAAGIVLVNGGAPHTGELPFALRAGDAHSLDGSERRPLAAFGGGKVWAVAGIGNPERFAAGLRLHGIVAVSVPVPDHGRTDLHERRREAPWPILMTEKDAVKYPRDGLPDAWYVPVEVDMQPEIEAAVMSRVRESIRAARSCAPGHGVARGRS
jgi:tetraacyldisaccharide 4'-kinase